MSPRCYSTPLFFFFLPLFKSVGGGGGISRGLKPESARQAFLLATEQTNTNTGVLTCP